MKKIIFVILIVLLGTTLSFAKMKDIRFSVVLSEEEAKTMPSKKYPYASREDQKPKNIFISNKSIFSKNDINSMIVVKKQDTKMKDFPIIDVVFTKEGSAKLADVSAKNLRKSIAIIVGDQVIYAPYIIYPLVKGHFMISTWNVPSDGAAKKFIEDIGFSPVFKEQIDNIDIR